MNRIRNRIEILRSLVLFAAKNSPSFSLGFYCLQDDRMKKEWEWENVRRYAVLFCWETS